jgi:hypothetical protein
MIKEKSRLLLGEFDSYFILESIWKHEKTIFYPMFEMLNSMVCKKISLNVIYDWI